MTADPGAHVARLLDAAARGWPPPADGEVEVLGALDGAADAVLGFTRHHLVAAPLAEAEIRAALAAHGGDGGDPLHAGFLRWLGERLAAEPGSVDVVLACTSRPPAADVAVHRRDDLDHPRVERARRLRSEVAVFTDTAARGMVTVSRGLVGRREVSVEVAPEHRGQGVGRALVGAALRVVERDEPVFAQCAAADVAALRALLAVGFRPVGAEVLFARA